MTTNGVLLAANARALRDAGLHRLTVSLDTLQPDRFRDLTRYDELDRVLDGIAAAAPLFPGLKLDTVVIRGVNDDELVDLIEFGRAHRRRGPVHRIHGRGRRHALVDAAGGAAARDAGRGSSALRRDHAVVEESSAPADRYRCRTARPSGSSRRRRSRSAIRAIAAG